MIQSRPLAQPYLDCTITCPNLSRMYYCSSWLSSAPLTFLCFLQTTQTDLYLKAFALAVPQVQNALSLKLCSPGSLTLFRYQPPLSTLSNIEFLKLGSIELWGWVILCGVVLCIPRFLAVSLASACQICSVVTIKNVSSNIPRDKTPLIENH